jgi:hypothetical protein
MRMKELYSHMNARNKREQKTNQRKKANSERKPKKRRQQHEHEHLETRMFN